MDTRLSVAVLCVPLLFVGTIALAQPNPTAPIHTKTWQNLTNPGGPVRVGDTVEFTIAYDPQCGDWCAGTLNVALQDPIESGLSFLNFSGGSTSGCSTTATGFQCALSWWCPGPGPSSQQVLFRTQVVTPGLRCNQSLATATCPPGPAGPLSVSDDPAVGGNSDPTCFNAVPAVPSLSARGAVLLFTLLVVGLAVITLRRRRARRQPSA